MIKRNLSLFVCITSFFLVCGCLKSNSDTSSVIEDIEGECSYIYPIYENDSDSPSRYCFTKCTKGCPTDKDVEEFNESTDQHSKDAILFSKCPITLDNTEYFEGKVIITQFNNYLLNSNDKLKLRKFNKESESKPLKFRINTLISSATPIPLTEDTKDKCSRVLSKNEGTILSSYSEQNKTQIDAVKQNYRIVKCNEKKIGFKNINSKLLYILEEKKVNSYQEARNYAIRKGGTLPDEKDCTTELIDAARLFLKNQDSSSGITTPSVLGTFWLSNSKHCKHSIKLGYAKFSHTETAYFTTPSQANLALETILIVKKGISCSNNQSETLENFQ